jgi:hypothetical protein
MTQWFKDFRRRWLLPPGFRDAFNGAAERAKAATSLSRRTRRKLVHKNVDLRNKYVGRRCFVIGNGPSLAGQDLSLIRDDVTIVMNAFHRHPILDTGWRPTAHCMVEPVEAYADPLVFELLREATRIPAEFHVFPLGVRPLLTQHRLLPEEKIRVVSFRGNWADHPTSRLPDLAAAVPFVNNTAHLAIVLAMHLGCSPIYLLGFDHDWLSYRGMARHFSQPHERETKVGGLWDLRRFPYLELMESTVLIWKTYIRLGEIASAHGIEIFNATDGGFLDVFERVRYERAAAARRAA